MGSVRKYGFSIENCIEHIDINYTWIEYCTITKYERGLEVMKYKRSMDQNEIRIPVTTSNLEYIYLFFISFVSPIATLVMG